MYLTREYDRAQIKHRTFNQCRTFASCSHCSIWLSQVPIWTLPLRWSRRLERIWKVWHNVWGDLAGSAEVFSLEKGSRHGQENEVFM